MSIKIKVTQEMSEALRGGPLERSMGENEIARILYIVERDLNAIRIDGGLTPAGTHGCIEVEG